MPPLLDHEGEGREIHEQNGKRQNESKEAKARDADQETRDRKEQRGIRGILQQQEEDAQNGHDRTGDDTDRRVGERHAQRGPGELRAEISECDLRHECSGERSTIVPTLQPQRVTSRAAVMR